MKIVYALTLLFILGLMMQHAAACICTAEYSPVCATNGQTYSNSCRMACAGATLFHPGAC